MNILYTKYPAVEAFVRRHRRIDRCHQLFHISHLEDLPPESLIIGNLPIPVAATICKLGHHYEHVIIPHASNPEARTKEALFRFASLKEFHVAEID